MLSREAMQDGQRSIHELKMFELSSQCLDFAQTFFGGQFNDSAIHFIGRLAKKWQAGKTRREKAGVFFVGSSRVTTNGVTRSFAALFRFAHIGTMLRG